MEKAPKSESGWGKVSSGFLLLLPKGDFSKAGGEVPNASTGLRMQRCTGTVAGSPEAEPSTTVPLRGLQYVGCTLGLLSQRGTSPLRSLE